MKLADVILISLAAAFLIMGIHQIITVSFGKAYWLVMLSTMLFFVYLYRKKR
jgi:type IV secretory pathway TrbD component